MGFFVGLIVGLIGMLIFECRAPSLPSLYQKACHFKLAGAESGRYVCSAGCPWGGVGFCHIMLPL